MHKSSLVEKSKVSKENYHKEGKCCSCFKYQHQHKIAPAKVKDGTENSVKLLCLSDYMAIIGYYRIIWL